MLLHILYLIGITAEAMTGALAAGRRRMDTFGVIIIATATALGGGSVRDILLGGVTRDLIDDVGLPVLMSR